ncbi:3-oxoacyl-[acyl-carrier-protein] reductase FabG [bacterium HR10]|uniref:3-oxoacyl-[acyl-carrier protein] reductase n=1 Tax=uncultured Acidobacteriota bacterium TaxID=171953 RepID=H5SCG8_9BACT|nr:3-oxoacyl-[acyl-carrier protein] reductase [uncultured Acidobacteriota bacterium]GBC83156.1 3-oxoacyl-[acyl-carrier-protein] reductase FabG [bacterium HR10]
MKLTGKVAIVTGGGTGIGRGIVRSLAEAGARVVIAQRRVEKARAMAEMLRSEGFEAMAVGTDISKRPQVQELVARTLEHWGRVDVLVNNAAITGMPAIAPFLHCTDEQLDQIVEVNLKGTFICSQEVARVMVRQGGGSIIHISSVAAFAAQEGAAAYCATKAGIVGLTRAMALELAPYGIRVNCVAPGDILIETNEALIEELRARGISGHYARRIPLGRRGEPRDIGPAVAFLASEDAAYITGATLIIDGGFLIY